MRIFLVLSYFTIALDLLPSLRFQSISGFKLLRSIVQNSVLAQVGRRFHPNLRFLSFCRAIMPHLGAILAHLGAILPHLGAMVINVLFLYELGVILAQFQIGSCNL